MSSNHTKPVIASSNIESDMGRYFSGKELYGNDFSASEILEWFNDEEQGYFDLEESSSKATYPYSALNWQHGFQHVSNRSFNRVLGIGSAYGHELNPVLENLRS